MGLGELNWLKVPLGGPLANKGGFLVVEHLTIVLLGFPQGRAVFTSAIRTIVTIATLDMSEVVPEIRTGVS